MTGRLLRRRDALVAVAAGLGVAWWGRRGARPASAARTCRLSPEQVEGPFYVPGEPVRSDVTEGRPGIPLRLRLRVRDATRCRRITDATVEIWHTDAAGEYSGVNGTSTTFMRGQQATDRGGRAAFTTIYPGWYPGRTPHIHVKVHVAGAAVHTGQLYFDDATTDAVYARDPYAARGRRDTTNAGDGIYARGGAESTLALRRRRRGYGARITLVVQT
jgi:protocatechuate 3,4-dioxygenase beta subunit